MCKDTKDYLNMCLQELNQNPKLICVMDNLSLCYVLDGIMFQFCVSVFSRFSVSVSLLGYKWFDYVVTGVSCFFDWFVLSI